MSDEEAANSEPQEYADILNTVDSTAFGEDDWNIVIDECGLLAAKWEELSTFLGLPYRLIASIKGNHPNDNYGCWSDALNQWISQNYNTDRFGVPSWMTLLKAVAKVDQLLYKKLAKKHQIRKRNHDSVDVPPTKVPRIKGPLFKFRPKLADFYSKKPEVPEGTWPPVKKTHYVNLALIKQAAINFAKDLVRQTVHGSIDDIIKDKEKIDYEDAFDELEDGALVLVEGRPGCGKTTLMHKLSQDWEKREILVSRLFFLVHFRRFSNRSDIKLSDILRAATLDYTDEEINEICTNIERESGRGVVFALDGLDEYCPESKCNLFYNLIKRERLANCIVIVASRPAASQKFRKYATKHVEVLGFLKPQIHEYIDNYFNECPDKAHGLLRYLEHHLNVMHMCYLPLHSAMVTYLYDMEGANLPQTETEIYKHFTLWTLIRSFKKQSDDPDAPFIINDFDDLSQENKKIFDLILKLAFNATVDSKQVFTLNEVKKNISEQLPSSGSGNNENSLGLIIIDRYYVKYGLDEIYTFLHLTFQEFLAAWFVANQDELEQATILKTHSSKENLAEVWKFYCGSGRCSSENFKLLLDESKQIQTNRSRKKKDFSSILLHLHCAYESQQEEKCHQIVETYDSSIVLDNISLNPIDMTAVGYVVVNSKASLTELAITSCHLGPEGLAAFATVVGDHILAVENLNFRGTVIKQDMSKEFAFLLNTCPSIKSLNVSKCSVIVKSLSDISSNIPELTLLTKLDISSNQLGKTGSAVESLLIKTPHLQTIVIHLYKDCQWYVSMKKKGQLKHINVKTFVPRKESEQDLATCTELDLSVLKISAKEAEVIGERLKECTNLYKLNLGHNYIGATGAQAIAEGCKSCPNLQTIVLGDNQIGDTEAQAIAEGCKLCPNLQTIVLNYNKIGDTGAQAIAEGCKLCLNLQTINLRYNSITDASVPQLIGLIEAARKLEKLFLWSNQFTDAGKSQLRQAAEKRNNDQANYVHLNLSV